jgi:hypothetical protein
LAAFIVAVSGKSKALEIMPMKQRVSRGAFYCRCSALR